MRPHLLIASPQMRDRNFAGTVVLVWAHTEKGAIGVVVNRLLEPTLQDVVDTNEAFDLAAYDRVPVAWGGPVRPNKGWVVTTGRVREEEGWMLDEGIGITDSQDALFRLLEHGDKLMLCLGYAGWEQGQLESEIAAGGWLWTDCERELLFEVPADERYERALATLGLTSQTVWMTPIDE